MYDPPTSMPPTNFHWSVGDSESNEPPLLGGFVGCICTVAGAAGDTETGTTATTHKGTSTIDVQDCTVFSPQQWVTVKGVKFSKEIEKPSSPKHAATRVIRVIGLGHRSIDTKTKFKDRGLPTGRAGKLIVELKADIDTKANIVFQKAEFQQIRMTLP